MDSSSPQTDWFDTLQVSKRIREGSLAIVNEEGEIGDAIAQEGLNGEQLTAQAESAARAIAEPAEDAARRIGYLDDAIRGSDDREVRLEDRSRVSAIVVCFAVYVGEYIYFGTRRGFVPTDLLAGVNWLYVILAVLLPALLAFALHAIFVRYVENRFDVGALYDERNREEARLEATLLASLRKWFREAINQAHVRSYGVMLNIKDAPGLAEVSDPKYEIPTDARTRIERLLSAMPGGAVGIAGQRGAGKTTVIRHFCGPRLESSEESGLLRVLVAAPVQYDARDFVLHLFSSVCEAVIQTSSGNRLDQAYEIASFTRIRIRPMLLYLVASLVSLVGILILVLSLFDISVPPGLAWGIGLLVLGFVVQAGGMLWWRAGRYTTFREASRDDDAFRAQEWLERIRFQHSYTEGWSGSLRLPVAVEAGVSRGRGREDRPLTYPEIVAGFRAFVIAATTPKRGDNESSQTVYGTQGWRRVFVGIDELDKIGSDEDAQRFLNEIKALFGLERCFYLISVSESAMSNFERRGLPFRDVFDSSFDEVVDIGYLDLDATRRLLNRRIIGLSEPFICLAHCMSGGLPRDLIRVARAMVDVQSESIADSSITEISARLVERDLQAKLQAMAIASARLKLGPGSASFLARLHEMGKSGVDSARLVRASTEFIRAAIDLETGDSEKTVEAWTALVNLHRELAGFLYYSATILEFFGPGLDETKIVRAQSLESAAGGIEQLAQARQVFAIDVGLSWAIVTDFRNEWGLEPVRSHS
jgi:hypothetical protein